MEHENELPAAKIVSGLGGDKAQREAAYVQMLALARGEKSEEAICAAAACIGPATTAVYGADASNVDATELQRANLVLCDLFALEPLRLIAESLRAGAAWDTPGNAYSVIFEKDISDLTRDDAMTVSCRCAIYTCQYARGNTPTIAAADGLDEPTWVAMLSQNNRLFKASKNPASDAFMQRLLMLVVDIFRDPQGTSELALAGAGMALCLGFAGRPQVATTLVQAKMFEVLIGKLHKSSPMDWVSSDNWNVGMVATGIFAIGWTYSTLEMPHKIQQLLDTGFIHVGISLLKAFELRGRTERACVGGIWSSILMISMLDLSSEDAVPIVKLLKGIPSALTFLLENNMQNLAMCGWSTAGQGSAVCALAFGREEEGDFRFSQEMIEGVLTSLQTVFSDEMLLPFYPNLAPTYLRPVLHLCISDVNKMLLIQTQLTTTLLTEALFLNLDHARQGQEEVIKAAIQQDATECFLQLALYEPGRLMLSDQVAVLEALHALVDGRAFSEEAKLSARGALIAIEGRRDELEHEREDGDAETHGHVMVSYQWDVQRTIVRIVRSMQSRGYDVWFDLDRMKGSTMDAMSEGVDGAEAFLYGVSLAYKESANCRLEANYAHQQENLNMIPLMMQKDYKAKGWLGLLMGSRMYYHFYSEDVEDEDQAVFETRIDQLIREIGDLGKLGTKPAATESVPEGVPPVPAPAPTPMPDCTFTPSMQMAPVEQHSDGVTGGVAQFTAFFKEVQQNAKVERDELKSRIEELASAPFKELISAEQLATFEARLDVMYEAKLLSDTELFALEDACADYLEIKTSEVITSAMAHSIPAAAKLARMISVSEGIASNVRCARQLKRKFV